MTVRAMKAGAVEFLTKPVRPHEREVMAHVVAGLANKPIAGELATTERTINFHRAHLMEKMEAASLAELVQMGGQLGSSPPESRAGPVPKDS